MRKYIYLPYLPGAACPLFSCFISSDFSNQIKGHSCFSYTNTTTTTTTTTAATFLIGTECRHRNHKYHATAVQVPATAPSANRAGHRPGMLFSRLRWGKKHISELSCIKKNEYLTSWGNFTILESCLMGLYVLVQYRIWWDSPFNSPLAVASCQPAALALHHQSPGVQTGQRRRRWKWENGGVHF